MSGPAISPVVRAILSANLDLPADEVIKRAKARGVTAPDASIRTLVHNIRSELKKARAKGKPVAAPAAARQTAPKAAGPQPAAKAAAVPAPAAAAVAPNLAGVFANVSLVNKVVGVTGGVDQARQVAEAVRACGGVDGFLQHLDLVAGIRSVG